MIFELKTWVRRDEKGHQLVICEAIPMYAASSAEDLKVMEQQARFTANHFVEVMTPQGQRVQQPFNFPIKAATTIDQAFAMFHDAGKARSSHAVAPSAAAPPLQPGTMPPKGWKGIVK